MSEPKGIYGTGNDPIPSDVFYCPQCGFPLGRIYHVDGVDLLRLGGSMVQHHDGTCLRCKSRFYWSVNGRALARLLARVAKLHEDDV